MLRIRRSILYDESIHILTLFFMKGKGLLFGLLSGALLGVLFAPESGKKMREKLKKEREEGGTGISTLKDSLVEMGTDVLDSIEQFNVEEENDPELKKKKIPKKK